QFDGVGVDDQDVVDLAVLEPADGVAAAAVVDDVVAGVQAVVGQRDGAVGFDVGGLERRAGDGAARGGDGAGGRGVDVGQVEVQAEGEARRAVDEDLGDGLGAADNRARGVDGD